MAKNRSNTAEQQDQAHSESQAPRDNTVNAKTNTVITRMEGDTKIEEAGPERTATVQYDFGTSLDEAVQKFGTDVVFNRFLSAVVIDLQALIRRGIKAGKSDAEIQEIANAWKPGVKQVIRKSAQEKIKDAFASLNDEQRAELLRQLKADLAGGAA